MYKKISNIIWTKISVCNNDKKGPGQPIDKSDFSVDRPSNKIMPKYAG